MFVRSIRIKNFMVHQDTTVEFRPLTVFVGPNGSGKSALFDALLNFSMLSRGSLRQAHGPYPYSFMATIHKAAPMNATIGYDINISKTSEDDEFLKYEIAYRQVGGRDDMPQFLITKEKLGSRPNEEILFDRQDAADYSISHDLQLDSDRSVFSALRRNPTPAAEMPLVSYLTHEISKFNKFRLDPAALAAPSRLPEIVADSPGSAPRLGYHGEDLPTVLNFLAETQDPAYQVICDSVRSLIPEFDTFEFSSVGVDRVAFSVRYTDGRGDVTAVRLSSGMLTFIGLITLVSSPTRPPVIMIEEPENGLTPQAISLFYQAVRELAFAPQGERSQVLISSHSPFVICEAWNGEDRDFIYQVKVTNGKSQIRKFSDVIAAQGIHLGKVEGERKHLSLKTAEDVMSGRYS